MLNFLTKNFPGGYHYIVQQRKQDEINSYFERFLYNRLQFRHKKDIWGKIAEQLPAWGKALGWVPDHFPILFLSETVALEVTESISSKRNELNPVKDDISISHSLLKQLDIFHLADRNPFFLSQGETKLVWFLCQWAKSPEYLVIGDLPVSLSVNRLEILLNFIKDSHKIAEGIGFQSPTFILGCNTDDWYERLLSIESWKLVQQWPATK